MEMIPVNSAAMLAVGYDDRAMQMQITFQQGDTYTFCGVPRGVFEGLLAAASKGSYYNDHIKDRYQC